MKRRAFIGMAGSTSLLLLAGCNPIAHRDKKHFNGAFLFLEAEQFDAHGGWDLDQQSIDQMGSPYLLAHGLGIPVQDASTHVKPRFVIRVSL